MRGAKNEAGAMLGLKNRATGVLTLSRPKPAFLAVETRENRDEEKPQNLIKILQNDSFWIGLFRTVPCLPLERKANGNSSEKPRYFSRANHDGRAQWMFV